MNDFENDDDEIEFDGSDLEQRTLVQWKDKAEYTAYVTEAKKGLSSAGNPMIIWTLKFPDVNNWTLDHYTVTQGDGKFKLAEIVKALGLGKEGEKIKFKLKDAKRRQCRVKIKMEEYDGKPRAKVAFINPHAKGPNINDEENLPF
jgi:hypothetical protein